MSVKSVQGFNQTVSTALRICISVQSLPAKQEREKSSPSPVAYELVGEQFSLGRGARDHEVNDSTLRQKFDTPLRIVNTCGRSSAIQGQSAANILCRTIRKFWRRN